MKLLLIRHGQTPGNVLGQLDTAHPGPGLTDLGLFQAQALATSLDGENLDAIYASTLVRTQLTAGPISVARGIDIHVRNGLHEIGAGDLELRSDPDSILRYLHTVYAWGLGELNATMPGGTDGVEFFDRFDADIDAISNSGADVAAAFSHGAAIRVWVSRRALNIDPSFGAEHSLANTGVVALEGSQRHGWTLAEWQGDPITQPVLPH